MFNKFINSISIKRTDKSLQIKKNTKLFIITEIFGILHKFYFNVNRHINLENEFNRCFFYIRANFYEFLQHDSKWLFTKEWQWLFNKNTHNYVTVVYNIYYIRSKNLYRLFNVQNKKYSEYNTNSNTKLLNFYYGILSLISALKIWVFSVLFFSISFYILLIKRTCVLPQTLFFWIGLSMLLYWLLSGFVFFVKKYQFSRYTSVIQRFWRRTYILFWLIESGLLLVFFYLMMNASQESFYMLDQGYFLKSHLFSWKLFLFKCILVASLITYSYLLLLNFKWSTFNKNIFKVTIITLLLLYLVWAEFYQIYWVSNFYANFSWLYDAEESMWSLEWDARRTRILNHYIMVLFLLKFWHIVFILGCWVFFLLRSNELDTITYPIYSFNFQNFIILFLMMWLFMYPWFRHTYHWLAEIPYFWFYVDIHISFYKIFINDFYTFYESVLYFLLSLIKNNYDTFNHTNFINWNLFTAFFDTHVFIKSTVKDVFIKNL